MVPKVSAQLVWSSQINLSTVQEFREFTLYPCKSQQSRCMPRFELHEHINIAIRPKVRSEHRAKKGQPTDGVFAAKLCQIFMAYVHMSIHLLLI